MKRYFDIKQLRNMWKHKQNNSFGQHEEVQEELTNSPSSTMKYFAKLNFYNTLLSKTNDLTTLDNLIVILEDLSTNPIIPENVLEERYYLEQWNSHIKFMKSKIIQQYG